MAERLVDRAEKGATLALPLLRGEPIGRTIEVFVLPAVVARQALYIGTVDHGSPIMGLGDQRTDVIRFPSSVKPAPILPGRRSPRTPPVRRSRDRTAPCGQPQCLLCRDRR